MPFFLVLFFSFIFSFQALAVEYSDSCGKEWEWRNPLPQGNDLSDVTWSDSEKLWVVVGSQGTILTSTDSVNWTVQNSGTTESLSSVKHNGKQWVAVGSEGIILTSSDAVNWIKQYSGTIGTIGRLGSIDWNGEQWLAVDDYGSFYGWFDFSIHSSKDGKNWSVISTISNDYKFNYIYWNGSYWLGVGKDYIVMSVDGINWSKSYEIDSHTLQSSLRSIEWNGKFWVAVGTGGAIYTSTNALTWTEQTQNTTQLIIDVVWNSNYWVAVGDKGTIFRSSDGFDWIVQNSGVTAKLNSIAWNGEQFIAVGGNFGGRKGTILTSLNGIDWTDRSLENKNEIVDIAWGDGQWLAISNKSIISSTDGKNWFTLNIDNTIVEDSFIDLGLVDFRSIAWNGSQWMVIGVEIILSSTDGINWFYHEIENEYIDYFMDITWDGKQWIMVGTNFSPYHDGVIYSSPDGINWIKRFYGIGSNFRSVSSNGNQSVVFGNDILKSTDAITWTELDFNSTDISYPQKSAWNGNEWIMVGGYGNIIASRCTRCVTETAEISLKDWIIHIGMVDYQPTLESSTVIKNVGLKYRNGTYPYVFDLSYVEQLNGHFNCADNKATYKTDDLNILSIPSLRILDTGGDDVIWDNLSFKLIDDGQTSFKFIEATPR